MARKRQVGTPAFIQQPPAALTVAEARAAYLESLDRELLGDPATRADEPPSQRLTLTSLLAVAVLAFTVTLAGRLWHEGAFAGLWVEAPTPAKRIDTGWTLGGAGRGDPAIQTRRPTAAQVENDHEAFEAGDAPITEPSPLDDRDDPQ